MNCDFACPHIGTIKKNFYSKRCIERGEFLLPLKNHPDLQDNPCPRCLEGMKQYLYSVGLGILV